MLLTHPFWAKPNLSSSKPIMKPVKTETLVTTTCSTSFGASFVYLIQPSFEKGGYLQDKAKLLTLKKLVNPTGSSLPQVTRITNKTQLKILWKGLDQKLKDLPNINWQIHQPVLVTVDQKFEAKSLDRVKFSLEAPSLSVPKTCSVFEMTINPGPFGKSGKGTAWYLGVMEKSVLDNLPKVELKK